MLVCCCCGNTFEEQGLHFGMCDRCRRAVLGQMVQELERDVADEGGGDMNINMTMRDLTEAGVHMPADVEDLIVAMGDCYMHTLARAEQARLGGKRRLARRLWNEAHTISVSYHSVAYVLAYVRHCKLCN